MTLSFEENLEFLLKNNQSGSSELLSALNDIIKSNYIDCLPPQALINKLKKHFFSFQTFKSYFYKIEEFISCGDMNAFTSFVDNFDSEQEKIIDRIFENTKDLFKKSATIITISNSNTLLKVILKYAATNSKIKIIVSESRPICEGRIMAEKLANAGIPVSLITEALIFEFVQKSDFAIIGADKILKDGSIINKVGSNLIALACNYFNKPLYVITDKTKYSENYEFVQELFPSIEVWHKEIDMMQTMNFYFEKVDATLIAGIITD